MPILFLTVGAPVANPGGTDSTVGGPVSTVGAPPVSTVGAPACTVGGGGGGGAVWFHMSDRAEAPGMSMAE